MRFDAALSALSAVAVAASLPAAAAVNFVIIQPDDMQFYEEWNPPPYLPWTGGYPGKEYPSNSTLPWINKLREEGLTMTQAYAASPKCGTSRYSTVTGRYATRSSYSRKKAQDDGKNNVNPAAATIPNTKLRDTGSVPDGSDCSVSNLAQAFANASYATGMVGKWHLTKNNQVTGTDGNVMEGVRQEIVDCGFADVEAMYPDNLDLSGGQEWSDRHGLSHNMEYVAYKAVEFIHDNAGADWFLYVNPTVPHGPEVLHAMGIDCRITTDGDFTSTMAEGWSVPGMTAEFGNDCDLYRDDVKRRAGSSTSDDDLGAIWVDDAVGAIYKALDDTDQLDDTLVLFQLDHGKAEKDKIWEGGVRIPQFIHYPNGVGTAPREWSGLVSTIDIGPTLLDYAGIAPTYDMDGKSWKDAIDPVTGSEDDWKNNRCLFFESSEDRAVRCGCDKLMLLSDASDEEGRADSSGWWNGTEVLFDLCDGSKNYIVADSSTSSPEAVNLMADQPAKAADLRDLLQCHLDRTDATIDPLYAECTGSIATPSPTVTPKPTLPVANNGGVPELIEYSPWQNDIFPASNSMVLSASVLDDDIKRVRMNLRYPDGSTLGFAAATKGAASGDLTPFSRVVDTTAQSGKYGFKFLIQDESASVADVCFPADCNSWVEFLVADSAEEVVQAARDEIATIIDQNNPGVNLAAKFVRHGFHDCVGGCDGCVDMANPDNAGLDVPISALEPVVDMFTHFGVTRADIWVLAALVGSFVTQVDGDLDNRDFTMDWIGRPNCEDLHADLNCVGNACQSAGPHQELPSPNLNTHQLLEFFDTRFGFSDRDTVAIMGAHALGGLARQNSGYDGPNGWAAGTRVLNNAYYDTIVGTTTGDLASCDTSAGSTDACINELKNEANWVQVFIDNDDPIPDRWQWNRGTDPNHFVMVNSDLALVRDLDGMMNPTTGEVDPANCQWKCNRKNGCPASPACPHAPVTIGITAEYAADNGLFLEEFEVALKKMLAHGQYDTSAGCLSPPCTVGGQARRGLRGTKN